MNLTFSNYSRLGECLASPPGLDRNVQDVCRAFLCRGFTPRNPGGNHSCRNCCHFESNHQLEIRESRIRGGRFRPSGFK
jgi:hypothetical protein